MKTTFSTGKKYTHNGRRHGTLCVGMDVKDSQKLMGITYFSPFSRKVENND